MSQRLAWTWKQWIILEIAGAAEFTSVVVTHDFNQIDAFLQKS